MHQIMKLSPIREPMYTPDLTCWAIKGAIEGAIKGAIEGAIKGAIEGAIKGGLSLTLDLTCWAIKGAIKGGVSVTQVQRSHSIHL